MEKVIIVIIILLYCIIAVIANNKVSKSYRDSEFGKLIIGLSAPGCIVFLLILTIFSIPYFWLYPERHVNIIDVAGSKEQQQALQEYRLRLKKKSIFHRLFEKLHILHSSEPSLNTFLNQIGPLENEDKEG